MTKDEFSIRTHSTEYSPMTKAASQHCRMDQLEDVRIRTGESPNKLVPWLTAATSQQMMKRNAMCSIALFAPSVTRIS